MSESVGNTIASEMHCIECCSIDESTCQRAFCRQSWFIFGQYCTLSLGTEREDIPLMMKCSSIPPLHRNLLNWNEDSCLTLLSSRKSSVIFSPVCHDVPSSNVGISSQNMPLSSSQLYWIFVLPSVFVIWQCSKRFLDDVYSLLPSGSTMIYF